MKILVVDNDPAVREYMKLLLVEAEHEVQTADDGLDALKTLKTYTPDLAFIDLIMPNIDGKKLCQILRKRGAWENLYLVVLSAISSEENIDYKELGFNASIAKGPLKQVGKHVIELLNQLKDQPHSQKIEAFGFENLYKREITKELLSTKHHTDLILDNMAEGIIEFTDSGDIVFVNPAACRMLNTTEECILGSLFSSNFPESERIRIDEALMNFSEGAIIENPPVFLNDLSLSLQFLPVDMEGEKYHVCIIKDITKIQRAEAFLKNKNKECESIVQQRTKELADVNQSLRKEIIEREQAEEVLARSLQEKEILLKEVHHRVKNNLQIISSLLGLQSRRIKDQEFRNLYEETQERVRSIALVHEKLYQSETLSELDFCEYISSLVQGLKRSYGSSTDNIKILQTVEMGSLSIDKAVPLGLIVNELLSNSMKYAFHDGKAGEIHIDYFPDPANSDRQILRVRDSGRGYPEDFNMEQSNHLGLKIVHTLVRQVKGEITLSNDTGAEIIINFPLS